ncbi:hypothetical protein Brms1b_001432 [Colletotrichum noveboracense]|nr:hypothetical protein Brms1b_001432 [Colletotrichum noveboracense]
MAAEAIGLTASLIAISELCVKSIALYRTVKDATKDRARLAAEIQFCKALIDELQNASADDVWKATMEVLASPSKGFRHGLNVLKWPFEEKEIKKILDMIERQKASLSLALDNNSRILQDRVASEVGNNTESLKELKGLCGTLCQEIDVLDALDEANEKVQDLIVDRISNLPFQDVRLFCTSRSLPKFKHMFATTDEIEIAAFDDISIFVRKQVSLQSRLRTIIGTDSGLEKSIVDKVTKEANGRYADT